MKPEHIPRASKKYLQFRWPVSSSLCSNEWWAQSHWNNQSGWSAAGYAEPRHSPKTRMQPNCLSGQHIYWLLHQLCMSNESQSSVHVVFAAWYQPLEVISNLLYLEWTDSTLCLRLFNFITQDNCSPQQCFSLSAKMLVLVNKIDLSYTLRSLQSTISFSYYLH